MNFQKIPTQQKLLLEIPYDLVSTRIEALNPVLESIREATSTQGHYRELELNLQHCSMVDSAGLNFLVSLHKVVVANHGKVSARNLHKNVRRTFLFSRLDQFINIES